MTAPRYLLDTNICIYIAKHNDLWIAAHALAANLILVTNNVREFACVENLAIENWTSP